MTTVVYTFVHYSDFADLIEKAEEMDVAMKMAVRTYAINQNRAMYILAMGKFDVGNGSRDAPGNILDGIKLEETYRGLGFQVNFDQSGRFTLAEAEAGLEDFVDGLDPQVDMAAIAILSHGDYGAAGQIIEFSDGTAANLG